MKHISFDTPRTTTIILSKEEFPKVSEVLKPIKLATGERHFLVHYSDLVKFITHNGLEHSDFQIALSITYELGRIAIKEYDWYDYAIFVEET